MYWCIIIIIVHIICRSALSQQLNSVTGESCQLSEKYNSLKTTLFSFGHLLQCTDTFGLIGFSGPMAFE
jgi:hypothetical protein